MNGQSRPDQRTADTRSSPPFQGTRSGVTPPANGNQTGPTIARLSAPAQNIQVWMASVLSRLQPTSEHIGGYFARGARGLRLVGNRCARPDCNDDRLVSLHIYTSWPCAEIRAHAAMRYVGSPCVWRAGPARPNRETGHRGRSRRRSIRLISITVRGRVAVATSTRTRRILKSALGCLPCSFTDLLSRVVDALS